MTWKRVMRWDRDARLFRVCRVMWDGIDTISGRAFSRKISIALTPRLVSWHRELGSVRVTVFGVRVHFAKSFGGRFV